MVQSASMKLTYVDELPRAPAFRIAPIDSPGRRTTVTSPCETDSRYSNDPSVEPLSTYRRRTPPVCLAAANRLGTVRGRNRMALSTGTTTVTRSTPDWRSVTNSRPWTSRSAGRLRKPAGLPCLEHHDCPETEGRVIMPRLKARPHVTNRRH